MTQTLNGGQVDTLRYWWDSQYPDNTGWYVEALDSEGQFLCDSQKIWYPVDTDDFGQDEEAELVEALKAEFPDATIVGPEVR